MVEQVGDSHGNQYECVCGQEKIAYKDTDEEQRGGWVDCLEIREVFSICSNSYYNASPEGEANDSRASANSPIECCV